MQRTCFAIMPFAEEFADIDRIIAAAAKEVGLAYVRGDSREKPGSVLPQIVHDIRYAAVVVADISGHNPNVFYELGIAHQLRGADRVVLITQSTDASPYDVHEFRQLGYRHNRAGRLALRQALPAYLREAADSRADEETWSVVRGRLARTRLLVRDLQRTLGKEGTKRLDGLTIRIVASLGSLAISDREPVDRTAEAGYFETLIAERDTLRKVLVHGARLRAVINPPRRFAQALLPERIKVRYERLIGLLEGRSDITADAAAAREDVDAMGRCEFVLSPVLMPNLFIIGSEVAYEGMKRGGEGGFGATHIETSAEAVREIVGQFDRLFDDSRQDMIRTHPPDGCLVRQLKAFYDEATRAV